MTNFECMKLKDFYLFLKKPKIGQAIDINTFGSFMRLISLTILYFYIFLVISVVTIITPLKLLNLMPVMKDVDLTTINILIISIFAPITEECIFRLPLKLTFVNSLLFLTSLLYVLLHKHVDNLFFLLGSLLLFFIISYYSFRNRVSFLDNIKIFSERYFAIIFYTQVFAFGFIHLFNFNLNYSYFYLFPFFVIVQLMMGCFQGYIRVKYKYGIFYCILIHIIINTVFLLPQLFDK